MIIRMHRFLEFTRAEGPGNRACLWVQGCPIHCEGCIVPFTWAENDGELVTVEEIKLKILNGPRVQGITFVGGEPFSQAQALAKLGSELKELGLSVVTFTGYTIEELRASNRKDWHDLLKVTDLLLDGPFKNELADTSRPWVGSKNQRFHFLTDHYKHIENEINNISNRLEIRIKENGEILLNGMASDKDIRKLLGI